MKTRKTKKRNIIRRAVAFLLCMTMVLGLGMQDVIEQVYAEGVSAVSQEQSALETQNVESTEAVTPEEEIDPTDSGEIVPVTPEEEPTAPEEDKEPTEPANPADTEENTDVTTPPMETTEPANPADTEENTDVTTPPTETTEPTNPDDGTTNTDPTDPAAPETPADSNGSEPSGETTSGESTGTDEQKPPVEEVPTAPAETTGEEETPEEELPEEEKTYEAEQKVDNVTIHVSAEAGVLPEDAKLSVTPVVKTEITDDMSEEDKQAAEDVNALYEQTEQKLLEELGTDVDDEAGTADSEAGISILSGEEAASEPDTTEEKVLEGFLAYDISFLVEDEEGNESEIEPEGEVKVTFEFAEAVIPEEVSEDAEVSVAHMKESSNENGETEIAVEDLAETATVETTDKAEVTKVELSTESFSVFTIYWSKESNRQSLQIRVVDQNGKDIGTNSMLRFEDGTEKTVEEIAGEITVATGYSFDRAVIANSFDYYGTQVKGLRRYARNDYYSVNQYLDTDEQWNDIDGNQTVYFIYKMVPGDITIVDEIAQNGLLKAQPDDELKALIEQAESEGKSIKYVWSKSENGGEYEKVDLLRSAGNNYNLQGEHNENLDIVIDGADKANKTKYKVEVFIGDTEIPSGTSAEFVVPYYRDIQNGGFEDVLSDGAMDYSDTGHGTTANGNQWSNENYKYWDGVWQTTGVGSISKKTGQDIEILNTDTNPNIGKWYMHNTRQKNAYDGNQFAEINCEASGALYQDVLTDQEIELEYFLSHRARSQDSDDRRDDAADKYDTMYLVIMPSKNAVGYESHSRLVEDLNNLIKGIDYIPTGDSLNTKTSEEAIVIYNQNGILIARITSNADDWHFVSSAEIETLPGVSKTYKPTSSLSRFFFISGATYSNDNTVGNFVDAISFGQNTVAPVADKVTINIEKTVTGLTEDELNGLKNKLQFKITATDLDTEEEVVNAPLNGTIFASDPGWTWKAGEPDSEGNVTITGSYTASEEIEYTSKYLYKIEEIGADLGEYTLNSSLTIQADNKKDGGAILGNQDAARFSFTNAYTSAAKKDITFTKIWEDDNDNFDTRPDSLKVTLNATVTVDGEQIKLEAEDLGLSTLDLTIRESDKVGSDANRWRATWQDVPVYYIHNGQRLPIEYTVTEENSGDYVYTATEIRAGDGSEYTVDNTKFDGVIKPTAPVSSMANSAARTASSTANDNELGAPAHRKYITYDETTGKYTLNLDVTGKKGDAEGVDILFVIDNSPSMAYPYSNLLNEVKELLTGGESNPDNGIIDQIFAADGNVNSVAYVRFGGWASSDNTWYTSDDQNVLEEKINFLKANISSTNWKAAMEEADDVLGLKTNSENEKVVIFLSDGEPNSGGRGDTEAHCDAAIRAVRNSDYLKQARIFSIYMNEDSEKMMERFATGVEGYPVNGINLSEALTDILQMIIPEYKNVVIHDTLTNWVNPVKESDITVWKKTASSDESELPVGDYEVTVTGGKEIEVKLLNGGALDDGATYTVKFEVSPSQAAIDDYAKNGKYPDTGEKGTNTDGELGYFTNVSASVEYQVNGQQDSLSEFYKRPVIQVPEPSEADITIKKVWVTNDDTTEPEEIKVALYQSVNGRTPELVESITLKASEGWKVTVPDCLLRDGEDKYSYSVEEVSVPEGYTSWIKTEEDSSGNLTFTITNTYDRYSVDENYYIVNTLQTDSLQVTKNWEGDEEQQDLRRPVTIQISDRLNQTYDVGLDADVNWTKTIVVPRLSEAGYQAEELVVPENYQASATTVTGGNGVYGVSVTNTLQTISIDVKKVWKDGELGNHNEVQFKVQQWDEGSNSWVDTGRSGTLSAPEWSTTITGLKAGFVYQVVETNVPSGYKSDTIQDGNSFVITNTLQWNMVKTDKLLAGEEESDRSYLPGAVFELYRTIDDQKVATGTSSEDTEKRGIIEWKFEGEVNLNGEYKIVETKAPDGYQINEDGWTVKFKDGIPVEFDGKAITSDDVKENGIVLILENEMLYELPSTGGPGIYLYMLGGVALMMAGTLLVYKKRKEEVLRS